MKRSLAAAVLFIALMGVGAPGAWASGDDGAFAEVKGREGIQSKATRGQVADLHAGKDLAGAPFGQPMEFTVRLACQSAGPGDETSACEKAATACITNGQQTGVGLLYDILTRPRGSNQAWQFLASTCFVDAVPGAGPTVTMAMIQKAFHDTPWATAHIATQPEGNVTLVTLPTYFRVVWSAEGFQPAEIDAIDPGLMLGFHVDIRPKVQSFTYVFGDGTSWGPTTSAGGTYPTGDMTHTYQRAGQYAARVDTTFTADFRVNSGPWTPVPDSVTIPGPATTVTVKTAKAVLVH
ncbi:MAG: hypothetical protein IPL45_13375 [Actinomycetales bacterium]|nr:hypothetical protein [Actinomycetales bacterium]